MEQACADSLPLLVGRGRRRKQIKRIIGAISLHSFRAPADRELTENTKCDQEHYMKVDGRSHCVVLFS